MEYIIDYADVGNDNNGDDNDDIENKKVSLTNFIDNGTICEIITA